MGKIIKYTDSELDLIRFRYPDIGAIGVSMLINRTAGSVKKMASQIGVKVTKQYRTAFAIRANKSWERSEETRKRIGIGHRKYAPFKCETCGKSIGHHKKQCWSCYSISRRKLVSAQAIARRMLYAVWIYPIMARDEFSCQNCGTVRDISVHHLRTFKSIVRTVVKRNPQLSADNPEDRYILAKLITKEHTMDDGITLCQSCHMIAHGKKRGELLGTPERDNQQPSLSNVLEFVERTVQRLTGEDAQANKPDTSAPHEMIIREDIV